MTEEETYSRLLSY